MKNYVYLSYLLYLEEAGTDPMAYAEYKISIIKGLIRRLG